MMVQAEFLALVLVLVYVGAVMTLFLFVVMMLNIEVEVLKTRLLRWLPIGLLITSALVGLLYVALPEGLFNTDTLNLTQQVSTQSDTQAIGMVLYTRYVMAFELAAVLLLVAIIAAITLVHRPPIGSKRQSIRDQIMVDRNDRVTLVSMPAETCKE
jgi:NADH-quinone oxidoreductase subunit J